MSSFRLTEKRKHFIIYTNLQAACTSSGSYFSALNRFNCFLHNIPPSMYAPSAVFVSRKSVVFDETRRLLKQSSENIRCCQGAKIGIVHQSKNIRVTNISLRFGQVIKPNKLYLFKFGFLINYAFETK